MFFSQQHFYILGLWIFFRHISSDFHKILTGFTQLTLLVDKFYSQFVSVVDKQRKGIAPIDII